MQKRVTLFAGHYGSGKTNIAVNYALDLKRRGYPVNIADLDVVNPYFRTKDSMKVLNDAGIRLISSPYANSNVDIPAIPQEMYSVTDERDIYAVMDIGGDDRGALALGRYAPAILQEDNYEMLFVINCYRPLTKDPQSTFEIMREIEFAGGIPFTAIVNNSNLGRDTTVDTVLDSLTYAEEVSNLSGLPVKMTSVDERLKSRILGKIENPFFIKLQKQI